MIYLKYVACLQFKVQVKPFWFEKITIFYFPFFMISAINSGCASRTCWRSLATPWSGTASSSRRIRRPIRTNWRTGIRRIRRPIRTNWRTGIRRIRRPIRTNWRTGIRSLLFYLTVIQLISYKRYSFNRDYLSILVHTGTWGYLFHEISSTLCGRNF